MEAKRILFISQEIYPYLAEETPVRVLNRRLPELFQYRGYETRTFMPKFGDINERRNQLHEVIRLSGMNLIIDDSDHPLLLKVASIQAARIQIYFIDNDDFFGRRKGTYIYEGEECEDNDERTVFFTRGVIETVKKLRWTPDIILCSGWMAALVPLYIKKAYHDTPFFTNAKVVYALNNEDYKRPFNTHFTDLMQIEGITNTDVRGIAGFPVGYEEIMRLAIDNSDAFIQVSPDVNARVINYAKTSGKPLLELKAEDDADGCYTFCETLLNRNEE